jgi:hypothetical protein
VPADPGITTTSLGEHFTGFRGAVAVAGRLVAQDVEPVALTTLYPATQDIRGRRSLDPTVSVTSAATR